MGLYVSAMKELPVGNRSLYIYLLDYGWPAGAFEKLFKDNFGHLSARASETGAVVVMSGRGVHFANEVLDWHQVFGHDASEILPAILITHTNPAYFRDPDWRDAVDSHEETGLGDIALLPLKPACTTPDEFLSIIGSIFDDLDKGLTLRKFRASKFDVLGEERKSMARSLSERVGKAIILQPNIGGVGVDLKILFGSSPSQGRVGA